MNIDERASARQSGTMGLLKSALSEFPDIAVSARRPLTAAAKIALIEALAHRTGRPIDLVDLRTVGGTLLGQVLRHGQRLLGDDSAYGALISRHLFDQADFMPYRTRVLAQRRAAWIGK